MILDVKMQQQSASNLNPATYKQGYAPWPHGVYFKNARLA
jgi:hypothetical protein